MGFKTVSLYLPAKYFTRSYVLDESTQDLYQNDSRNVVRTKAVLLILGLPIFTGCYTSYNLLKVPVDIYKKRSRLEVAYDVWNAVKSPFYAIGVFGAALYTLCFPYKGRKLEAKIERSWQNNLPPTSDYRLAEGSVCCGCHKEAANSRAVYFAFCFQPKGKLTDKKFELREEEEIA